MDKLFSDDPEMVKEGLNTVEMWRLRGSTPIAVEATADLLRAKLEHTVPGDDEIKTRLYLAMVLVRLVNGVTDPAQRGEYAKSVSMLANRLGLSRIIVDIRHDATHKRLPSLSLLKIAADEALMFLYNKYWEPQRNALVTQFPVPSNSSPAPTSPPDNPTNKKRRTSRDTQMAASAIAGANADMIKLRNDVASAVETFHRSSRTASASSDAAAVLAKFLKELPNPVWPSKIGEFLLTDKALLQVPNRRIGPVQRDGAWRKLKNKWTPVLLDIYSETPGAFNQLAVDLAHTCAGEFKTKVQKKRGAGGLWKRECTQGYAENWLLWILKGGLRDDSKQKKTKKSARTTTFLSLQRAETDVLAVCLSKPSPALARVAQRLFETRYKDHSWRAEAESLMELGLRLTAQDDKKTKEGPTRKRRGRRQRYHEVMDVESDSKETNTEPPSDTSSTDTLKTPSDLLKLSQKLRDHEHNGGRSVLPREMFSDAEEGDWRMVSGWPACPLGLTPWIRRSEELDLTLPDDIVVGFDPRLMRRKGAQSTEDVTSDLVTIMPVEPLTCSTNSLPLVNNGGKECSADADDEDGRGRNNGTQEDQKINVYGVKVASLYGF